RRAGLDTAGLDLEHDPLVTDALEAQPVEAQRSRVQRHAIGLEGAPSVCVVPAQGLEDESLRLDDPCCASLDAVAALEDERTARIELGDDGAHGGVLDRA